VNRQDCWRPVPTDVTQAVDQHLEILGGPALLAADLTQFNRKGVPLVSVFSFLNKRVKRNTFVDIFNANAIITRLLNNRWLFFWTACSVIAMNRQNGNYDH
jgi:hypothetical protein